ncbi:MAG TPA: hypothetical protein PK536_05020 [Ignavibacteria bacterium]|nr:hypothetical protein [Bacteroidota bacterium]HRI84792.1 hypothetical protein [Ignavibacteria bacterium]HRJ99118.1 hypothetical protein [Ignavibacteria bacterium]
MIYIGVLALIVAIIGWFIRDLPKKWILIIAIVLIPFAYYFISKAFDDKKELESERLGELRKNKVQCFKEYNNYVDELTVSIEKQRLEYEVNSSNSSIRKNSNKSSSEFNDFFWKLERSQIDKFIILTAGIKQTCSPYFSKRIERLIDDVYNFITIPGRLFYEIKIDTNIKGRNYVEYGIKMKSEVDEFLNLLSYIHVKMQEEIEVSDEEIINKLNLNNTLVLDLNSLRKEFDISINQDFQELIKMSHADSLIIKMQFVSNGEAKDAIEGTRKTDVSYEFRHLYEFRNLNEFKNKSNAFIIYALNKGKAQKDSKDSKDSNLLLTKIGVMNIKDSTIIGWYFTAPGFEYTKVSGSWLSKINEN